MEDEILNRFVNGGEIPDGEVLCCASAYVKKFYLNPLYDGLPDKVKEELKILCVLFTEEVGGVLILYFDGDGEIAIRTESYEEDILYDEIGSGLLVRKTEREKRELFEALSLYRKTFVVPEEA